MKKEGTCHESNDRKKTLPSIKLYYRQQKPGQGVGSVGKHQTMKGLDGSVDPLQSYSPPSFCASNASPSPTPVISDDKSDSATNKVTPSITTTNSTESLAPLGSVVSRFCVQRHISSQLVDQVSDMLQRIAGKDRKTEFKGYFCILFETIVYNEVKRLSLQVTQLIAYARCSLIVFK